ncbi:MAG: CYTH domain-containing protein [Treponema sp.]|jgi:adenylate cyclase class 2|nr:CYTH domain-containing protein [Treponema sp.]
MPIEIELKAHAGNPELVKSRLDELAEFSAAIEKKDVYWFPSAGGLEKTLPSSGIRVRKESITDAAGKCSHVVLVTYKNKERRDGIEVNDEYEFEVSSAEVFEDMLGCLGLEPGIAKHKKGWAWKFRGVTAELVRVDGLGWFVELEIIADRADREASAEGRKQLLGLFDKLGIERKNIEERYYTEMLKALNGITV